MKPLQALLALFAFAFLPLHAASLDDLTYTTTDGKVTITDCNEAATGELVIPDNIEGNPVTSIGNFAFFFCGGLTSITIPDGVTSIGYTAFYYCESLTSITIPDGVASIGDDAFSYCSSLTSITIPDSVTSFGSGAFQDCPASIEIRPATQNSLAAQLAAVTAERDAAITERDTRPTQAAYDAAVATARTAGQGDVTGDPASYSLFTEDQINAMTTDPTIGRNAAGNMQVDISFIHSTDLQTFTPFAVNPAWVSVVDGKIALEFPPSDENTFFYRLGVQGYNPQLGETAPPVENYYYRPFTPQPVS
ncbi:leucine-rich repeat domain-containing protein [bacterium]|nr:leucine-rich repeat domain-containing protein [bacterium]